MPLGLYFLSVFITNGIQVSNYESGIQTQGKHMPGSAIRADDLIGRPDERSGTLDVRQFPISKDHNP